MHKQPVSGFKRGPNRRWPTIPFSHYLYANAIFSARYYNGDINVAVQPPRGLFRRRDGHRHSRFRWLDPCVSIFWQTVASLVGNTDVRTYVYLVVSGAILSASNSNTRVVSDIRVRARTN